MSLKATCFLSLGIFVLSQGAFGQGINVQLECKKQDCICGEPVLLRTVVSNVSGKDFKSQIGRYGLGPEFGFTLYVAEADGEFEDFLTPWPKKRLGISKPPLQYELFRDRHSLPGDISAGQKADRVDMLIVPKPGEYRLKAVLKERDGTVYASEPIRLRVLPLEEKEDSVSRLGKQDFVISLGFSIYYYHYVERAWGDAQAAKRFKEVAPLIMEQYKDSVFREYVVYAEAMAQCRAPQSDSDVAAERGKELAQQFIKEYPRSWLLPDIYRKLFWVYIQQKDKDGAGEVRKRALEVAPNASVLRHVKQANVDELLRQKEAQPGLRMNGR